MDNEVKGEGNSLNYTFRMHDPRVGRFFAVDPLTRKYPFYSPYSFSGNNVISHTELEGLEEMVAILNRHTDQPNLLATTGEQLILVAVSNALDITGNVLDTKSYQLAFRSLKEGLLMTSTGRVYNQTVMTTKDIALIDGSTAKSVDVGQNIGNRKGDVLNTTRAGNPVELFRPKWLIDGSELAKKAMVLVDVATWTKDGEVNGNALLSSAASQTMSTLGSSGAGIAAGLLLTASEYQISAWKNEGSEIIFQSLTNGKTSLKAARAIASSEFSNFSFETFYGNSMMKFLNGNIRDLQDLRNYDGEYGDSRSGSRTIMYTEDTKNDKAYINAIYISKNDEKP